MPDPQSRRHLADRLADCARAADPPGQLGAPARLFLRLVGPLLRLRGSHYTAPVLWRSTLLPWLLIFPRLIALKRLPVTLLGVVGVALIYALPGPACGYLEATGAAFLWLCLPIHIFFPIVPWTISARLGPRSKRPSSLARETSKPFWRRRTIEWLARSKSSCSRTDCALALKPVEQLLLFGRELVFAKDPVVSQFRELPQQFRDSARLWLASGRGKIDHLNRRQHADIEV